MKSSLFAGILCCFLWGCASSQTALLDGATAVVSVSSSFNYRSGMRVAVLPFTVTGNPDKQQDISEADIFCVKLREADFDIIDSTILQKHDLFLSGLVPEGDMPAIQKALRLDLIVSGTVNYAFDPGLRSLSNKGYYFPDSASVRFVDVASGEVVIISTVKSVGGSMAAEMGEAIKRVIGRQQP
jgi:hypothetical protein